MKLKTEFFKYRIDSTVTSGDLRHAYDIHGNNDGASAILFKSQSTNVNTGLGFEQVALNFFLDDGLGNLYSAGWSLSGASVFKKIGSEWNQFVTMDALTQGSFIYCGTIYTNNTLFLGTYDKGIHTVDLTSKTVITNFGNILAVNSGAKVLSVASSNGYIYAACGDNSIYVSSIASPSFTKAYTSAIPLQEFNTIMFASDSHMYTGSTASKGGAGAYGHYNGSSYIIDNVGLDYSDPIAFWTSGNVTTPGTVTCDNVQLPYITNTILDIDILEDASKSYIIDAINNLYVETNIKSATLSTNIANGASKVKVNHDGTVIVTMAPVAPVLGYWNGTTIQASAISGSPSVTWKTIALSRRNVVAYASNYTNGDMYKSTDGGATFAPVATNPFAIGADVIFVSGDGTRVFSSSGTSIKYSIDYGATWSAPLTYGSTNIYSIYSSYNGFYVYIATDLGIYISVNGGYTFGALTYSGAVYSITASEDGTKVNALTATNIIQSTNGANSFSVIETVQYGCDSNSKIVSSSDGNIVLTKCTSVNLYRNFSNPIIGLTSASGMISGDTFIIVENGYKESKLDATIPTSLALTASKTIPTYTYNIKEDVSNNRIYFCTGNKLYYSNSSFVSLTPITISTSINDITGQNITDELQVRDVAFTGQELLVATWDGLFYTLDSQSVSPTWYKNTASYYTDGNNKIQAIAINGSNYYLSIFASVNNTYIIELSKVGLNLSPTNFAITANESMSGIAGSFVDAVYVNQNKYLILNKATGNAEYISINSSNVQTPITNTAITQVSTLTACIYDGTYLYIGTTNGIYVVTDLDIDSAWMYYPIPGNNVKKLSYDGTHLIAVTDAGICISSNQAVSWSTAYADANVNKVLYDASSGISFIAKIDGLYQSTDSTFSTVTRIGSATSSNGTYGKNVIDIIFYIVNSIAFFGIVTNDYYWYVDRASLLSGIDATFDSNCVKISTIGISNTMTSIQYDSTSDIGYITTSSDYVYKFNTKNHYLMRDVYIYNGGVPNFSGSFNANNTILFFVNNPLDATYVVYDDKRAVVSFILTGNLNMNLTSALYDKIITDEYGITSELNILNLASPHVPNTRYETIKKLYEDDFNLTLLFNIYGTLGAPHNNVPYSIVKLVNLNKDGVLDANSNPIPAQVGYFANNDLRLNNKTNLPFLDASYFIDSADPNKLSYYISTYGPLNLYITRYTFNDKRNQYVNSDSSAVIKIPFPESYSESMFIEKLQQSYQTDYITYIVGLNKTLYILHINSLFTGTETYNLIPLIKTNAWKTFLGFNFVLHPPLKNYNDVLYFDMGSNRKMLVKFYTPIAITDNTTHIGTGASDIAFEETYFADDATSRYIQVVVDSGINPNEILLTTTPSISTGTFNQFDITNSSRVVNSTNYNVRLFDMSDMSFVGVIADNMLNQYQSSVNAMTYTIYPLDINLTHGIGSTYELLTFGHAYKFLNAGEYNIKINKPNASHYSNMTLTYNNPTAYKIYKNDNSNSLISLKFKYYKENIKDE